MQHFTSFALLLAFRTDAQALDRCNGCWCATNPDGTTPNETCPPYGATKGISLTQPAEVFEAYKTFQLTSPTITLQPLPGSSSSSCYPFRDTVGTIPGIPETEAPQCERPAVTSTSVCAFKYETTTALPTTMATTPDTTTPSTECTGRPYQVVQYPSAESAIEDDAQITHSGNCGICSNAHDLAIFLQRAETFQTEVTLCGISFALNPGDDNRFEKLRGCFMNKESIGLSEPCATLWAYYAATNLLCAEPCSSGLSGDMPLNTPEPTCAYSDCIACAEEKFQDDMNLFSGRTFAGSGIVEDRLIRPCNLFTPIVHDPCPSGAFSESLSSAPVAAPTSSGSKLGLMLGFSSLATTLFVLLV